jgi:outer membrane protein OmpA-like peptidoglycan-associated protein
MADEPVRQSISIDISDEGLAATHPLNIEFRNAVAPSEVGSSKHNSLRDFLQVVGCAMFPDLTFQFDSSLVGPEVRKATKRLALFREQLKERPGLVAGEAPEFPPLALFGHADPVGKRPYNSKLSGRRALAIYGMLLHKPAIWERLFQDRTVAGDVWGDPEFNAMLDEVGFEPELPPGSTDEQARKSILARLRKSSGDRAKLFSDYINAVCVQDDGKGGEKPFVLFEQDFLDRGERPDHKAAVQGCGEFNPVLILSQAKQNRFERTRDEQGRNAANEKNRRVLAFLFKPGTRIVPEKWPCPHVGQKDPDQVCKGRLWRDVDRRLAPDPAPDENSAKDRAFKETGDTMGCRFYHGFAQNSPCEGTLKLWVMRLGIDDALQKDGNGLTIEDEKGRNFLNHPIARKRYVVEVSKDAGAPIIRGRTDERGGIRLPVFDEKTTMSLKIDVKTLFDVENPEKRQQKEEETPEDQFLELVLKAGDLLPMREAEDPEFNRLSARQRLSNLSYGPNLPVDQWTEQQEADALTGFQRKHRLDETGKPDGPTILELRRVHGS